MALGSVSQMLTQDRSDQTAGSSFTLRAGHPDDRSRALAQELSRCRPVMVSLLNPIRRNRRATQDQVKPFDLSKGSAA